VFHIGAGLSAGRLGASFALVFGLGVAGLIGGLLGVSLVVVFVLGIGSWAVALGVGVVGGGLLLV